MNLQELIIQKVSESSQTAVARATGISQGTINKIYHGDTNASFETIHLISSAYGLDPNQFLPKKPESSNKTYGIQIDEITGKPVHLPKIRLISNVSGGTGHGTCWESTEDWISRPQDLVDEQAFAMKVHGESMSPKYTPGMIVYASPAQEIINGDYVVVEMKSGERIVKRYRRTNGTIILESINQSHDPIITTEYEINRMAKITHSKEK